VALLTLAGPSAATSPPTRVIACLGDSITVGVTHRGARDPLGGYPGRLQRRVGPQVRVLNRGLAGTTTAFWLTDPSSEDGPRIWRGLLQLWPDLPRAEPPRGAKSLTRATLDVDHPDLVVVLLGVNDLGPNPRARRSSSGRAPGWSGSSRKPRPPGGPSSWQRSCPTAATRRNPARA